MQSTKLGLLNLPKSDDQNNQTATNQSKSPPKSKPLSRNEVTSHVKHAVEGISSKIDNNSLHKIFSDIETEEGSSYFISAIIDVFDKCVSSSTLKALTVIYIILFRNKSPNFTKVIQFYLPELLTLTPITFKKPKDVARDTIHLLARSIYLYLIIHQKLPEPSYFGFDKNNLLFQFMKENSENNISQKANSKVKSNSPSRLSSDDENLLKSFSSNIPVSPNPLELNGEFNDDLIDFDKYEPKEKSVLEFPSTLDFNNELEIQNIQPPQTEANISLNPNMTIGDATFVDTNSSIDYPTLQKNPSAPFKPNPSFPFTESDKGSISTPAMNNKIIDDNHFIDLTQSSSPPDKNSNGILKTDSVNSARQVFDEYYKTNDEKKKTKFTVQYISRPPSNDSIKETLSLSNFAFHDGNENGTIKPSKSVINAQTITPFEDTGTLTVKQRFSVRRVSLPEQVEQIPADSPFGFEQTKDFYQQIDLNNHNDNDKQEKQDHQRFSSIDIDLSHQPNLENNSGPGSLGLALDDRFEPIFKENEDSGFVPITPIGSNLISLDDSNDQFEPITPTTNHVVPFLHNNKQNNKPILAGDDSDEDDGFVPITPVHSSIPDVNNDEDENFEPITPKKVSINRFATFLQNDDKISSSISDGFVPITPIEGESIIPNNSHINNSNDGFVPITPIDKTHLDIKNDFSNQFTPIENESNDFVPIDNDNHIDNETDFSNQFSPIEESPINNELDDRFVPIGLNQYNQFENESLHQDSKHFDQFTSIDRDNNHDFSDQFTPITPIEEETLIPNHSNQTDFSDQFVPISLIDDISVIPMQNNEDFSDQFVPIDQSESGSNRFEPIVSRSDSEQTTPDKGNGENKGKGKTRFKIHRTSSSSIDVIPDNNPNGSSSILFDKE